MFTAAPWMGVGALATVLVTLLANATRDGLFARATALPPATAKAIERSQKRCRADLNRALRGRPQLTKVR